MNAGLTEILHWEVILKNKNHTTTGQFGSTPKCILKEGSIDHTPLWGFIPYNVSALSNGSAMVLLSQGHQSKACLEEKQM